MFCLFVIYRMSPFFVMFICMGFSPLFFVTCAWRAEIQEKLLSMHLQARTGLISSTSASPVVGRGSRGKDTCRERGHLSLLFFSVSLCSFP